MNITRTAPRPQTKPSAPAQKKFEQAEQELSVQQQDHFQQIDRLAKRDTIAAAVGGAIGLCFTVAGMMNGSIQHGIVGAGPIVLGAVATGGISKMLSRHTLKNSTLPSFQEATQNYRQAREEYRDSILQNLNDPKVGEATNARWEKLADSESYADDPMFLMDSTESRATETMRNELGLLNGLADARQSEGWTGQLASLESDPRQFAAQKAFVEKHPNLNAVLKSNQD